jgi:hypothetical protein
MPVPFYIEAREFFALGSFEGFRGMGPLSRQCLSPLSRHFVTHFMTQLYDATSRRDLHHSLGFQKNSCSFLCKLCSPRVLRG